MKLHLTHDNVFIDYIINSATKLNLFDNKYLIYTLDGLAPKLVKSKNAVYANYDSAEFWKIVGDFDQYDTVYVHFMHGITSDFVNRLPHHLKVVWCFWGGDGLELPSMLKNVYQPKSFNYFKKHSKTNWLPLSMRTIHHNLYLIKRSKKVTRDNIKAIARVDYFAHYLEEDFALIKKHTACKATFIPFHYASLEDIVPTHLKKEVAVGNTILLGNSDTITNNHFEAIDKLSQIDTHGAKIYCPLSYEGRQYAKDVAAYGREKLGDNFVPMLTFLAKDKYEELLASTSIAVMNHNRSQALGNILALIYGGVKLYMNDESTLFHFLKKNGVHIYSISKDLTSQDVRVKLTVEEVKENQDTLLELFGKSTHLEKVKSLLTL